jgi:hypothetical protein
MQIKTVRLLEKKWALKLPEESISARRRFVNPSMAEGMPQTKTSKARV